MPSPTQFQGLPEEEHARRRALIDEADRLIEEMHVSQRAALKEVCGRAGIARATLLAWANRHYHLPQANGVFRQMTKAAEDYNREIRTRVGNKLMEAVELALEDHLRSMRAEEGPLLSTQNLKDLAITFGVATDKRRLEDGEATEREEVNVQAIREQVVGRLDELAARRSARRDGASPAGEGEEAGAGAAGPPVQ